MQKKKLKNEKGTFQSITQTVEMPPISTNLSGETETEWNKNGGRSYKKSTNMVAFCCYCESSVYFYEKTEAKSKQL